MNIRNYGGSKTWIRWLRKISTRLLGRSILLPSSFAKGTETSVFINKLLANFENATYLEIGVNNGATFEAISLRVKVAVDPYPKYFNLYSRNIRTYTCTSDDYFEKHCNEYFDLIYLDGLHHFDQTWCDLQNALRRIKPSGLILIDDIVPSDKFSGIIPRTSALEARFLSTGSLDPSWTGDIYKIGILLSKLPENFVFRVIDFRNNPRAILFSANYDWKAFPIPDFETIKRANDTSPESIFDFQFAKVPIPTIFRPISPDEATQITRNHIEGFRS